MSAKPVVYVANLPVEAADTGGGNKEKTEEAESIARVALAHAETVLSVQRDHEVPAVAACLMSEEGQEALGAKVSLLHDKCRSFPSSSTDLCISRQASDPLRTHDCHECLGGY